jgi:glycosyltransferase involved in cell wall biosynthesis
LSALSIVYVWDADYPWDVRTEKICLALTAAGHRVTIVARNRKWSPEREELPEGTVHRMPAMRWGGKALDGALGFPAFFSPRWSALIREAVRESSADLIIVRDLPLAPTAIAAGRKYSVPVALDMAENYPALMRDRRLGSRNIIVDFFARNPTLTAMVERYSIARVDWTFTVVEESSARLVSEGADSRKLSVVSNTPPRARAEQSANRRGSAPGTVTIAYLGLLEVARGIGELIDAIGLLREQHGGAFRAIVIGGGRDADLFIARARSAGLLDSSITFLGLLPHADALNAITAADIGVIPHHATELWNSTIPNKLFDYMAAGLPVISSDTRPCARIIEETKCGAIFHSGDARSMADAIARASAPSELARMSAAGRRAVIERYNWEHDTASLLDSIQTFLPRK